MKCYRTSDLVDGLLDALQDKLSGDRERFLLRQSLQALVRAAKVEQLNDIKATVAKAAGRRMASSSRAAARAAIRRAASRAHSRQCELQFE